MYVSQLTATVIYTVLKTILLFLLYSTITSVCALLNRFDLAKIFEQGNVTIIVGMITSDRYKKYKGMFVFLFIAISLEVIIGLLPTIATKFMPFENVFISDSIPKYFKTNFSTPIQNISITSSNDNMNLYCLGMKLCNIDGIYYNNIVNISNTMKVSQVEFNEKENKYITEFLNVSIYSNKFFNNEIIYNNYINITKETNPELTYFMMRSFSPEIYYDKHNSGLIIYSDILSLLYYPGLIDINSTINRADLIYSNGNNHVILTMKVVTSSYSKLSNDNLKYNNIYNNTQLYYNLSKKYNSSISSYTTIYSNYIYNNYYVKDYFQYSLNAINSETINEGRIIFGIYIINDKNFNVTKNTEINTIVNFNVKLTDSSLFNRNVDLKILEKFNDPPTNDLFMYAILSNSDGYVYGVQGTRQVVADISPLFIGIILCIITLLLTLYIICKYKKDKIFFSTLLETIGLNKLDSIINKEELEEKQSLNLLNN